MLQPSQVAFMFAAYSPILLASIGTYPQPSRAKSIRLSLPRVRPRRVLDIKSLPVVMVGMRDVRDIIRLARGVTNSYAHRGKCCAS